MSSIGKRCLEGVVTLGVSFGMLACSLTGEHVQREIDDLRELQVSRGLELDTLREEMQELRGRVEELEHERKGEVKSIKRALSTLQKRMPPPAVVPRAALEKALASAGALPQPVAEPVREALEHIREGAFAKAIALLEEVLAGAEGERYIPEVLFWMAVAHDGLEHDRPALIAYHRIIIQFPNSALVPAALLRQAQVFERMQDADAAREVLKKLVQEHPRSREAETARSLLGSTADFH
jgi:TolA-binding protein